MRLDDVDRQILRLLMEDGRMPLKEIAEIIGRSPATVKNRLEKLMATGVIKKFAPLVDHKLLGFPFSVAIFVQVRPGMLDSVVSYLLESRNVNALYEITGDYDLLVIAKFRSKEEFSEFIRNLLNTKWVERTSSSMIVKIHREEPSLPV